MFCGFVLLFPLFILFIVVSFLPHHLSFKKTTTAPFFEEEQSELFKKICSCEYEFNPLCWADVSPEAIDLIKSMLTLDPEARLTVDEALAHPWIKIEGASLASHSLSGNMVLYGKKYRASDLLKAAASQVIEVIRYNSNLSDIAGAINLVRKTSSISLTNTASKMRVSSLGNTSSSPTNNTKSKLSYN
jgi:serine/threonine protein kinase